MSWDENTAHISDWKNFLDEIEKFHSISETNSHLKFLFRGQADVDWKLEPSMLRGIPRGNSPGLNQSIGNRIVKFEEESTNQYIQSAHRFPEGQNIGDLDRLSIWSIMQHHHAVTRLLDWSRSIYVAAYFAVVEQSSIDGVVWYVRSDFQNPPDNIQEANKLFAPHYATDSSQLNKLFEFEPPTMVARMSAQQGVFTVSDNVMLKHDDLITEMYRNTDTNTCYGKIVIPAKQKRLFLGRLRSMNIRALSLFPDLEGIGRSSKELFQLRMDKLVRAMIRRSRGITQRPTRSITL